MGLRAGFSRINSLIRGSGFLALCGGAFCALAALSQSASDAKGWFVGAALLGAGGSILLIAAWIVSGFLLDSQRAGGDAPVPSAPRSSTATSLMSRHPIQFRSGVVIATFVVGALIVWNAYDFGRFTFAAFMIVLVVALIARAVQGSFPLPGARINLGASLTFAILALSYAFSLRFERMENRSRGLAQVQEMRKAVALTMDPSVGAPVSAPSAAPAGSSKSTLDDVIQYVGQYSSRQQSRTAEYQRELQRLGVNEWLTPATFLDSSSRAIQRNNLNVAARAVDRYATDVTAMFNEMNAYGERIGKVSAEGASVHQGMMESYPQSQRLLQEMLAAEKKTIRLVTELYDFLDSPSVGYQVRDGRILFARQEDLDRYQAIFREIQAVGERSARANRDALALRHAQLEKLNQVEQDLRK